MVCVLILQTSPNPKAAKPALPNRFQGCHFSTFLDNFQQYQPALITKMSGQPRLTHEGCPGDILLLIFEDLYRTAPASLRVVRLASRQFNILVIPIVYRHVKLNVELLNCFEVDHESNDPPEVVDARMRVRHAICNFTRQITIDKPVDSLLTVTLLQSLDKLHHLNWAFWNKESCSNHWTSNQILPRILDCLTESWPSADLSVDNVYSGVDYNDEVSSLPPTNVVSLKLEAGLLRHWHRVERTFKTFLLQCHQLNVLHLLSVRSGTRFKDEEMEQHDRLPAVEQLFLQGYFWIHSPRTANTFWNWSNLTSLRLEKVFIINFLESVLPANLLQLRSLITDGHCESAVDHTKVSVLQVMVPTCTSF